jgi:hypothetical protein
MVQLENKIIKDNDVSDIDATDDEIESFACYGENIKG